MEPLVDLTGIESKPAKKEYPVLPELQYETAIVNCKVEDGKSPGEKLLVTEFKILSPAQYEGRRLFNRFYIKGEKGPRLEFSLKSLKNLLECINWKSLKIEYPSQLEGQKVNCKTVNKEYNGKMYTNISYFRPHAVLEQNNETKNSISSYEDFGDIPF